MIGLMLLVVRENFFVDIVVPGIIGGFILLMIANSILKHFGYYLW